MLILDFMAILKIFLAEFEDKMWFGGYPQKFENLNKNFGFGGMWTLLGQLSEKLNFKFAINPKILHFDTKFHIFRSTWESNNFKTCF